MPKVLSLIFKRLLQSAGLMLAVITATFFLSSRIPGDFYSEQELNPGVNRQSIDRERQRHGLDQPIVVQYSRFLDRCFHLDLGVSLFYERPVRSVVLDALGKSLWIGLPALFLGISMGVLLGAHHARHSDDRTGTVYDLISNLVLALPTLVLGLGALILAVATRWFPLGGMSSMEIHSAGFLPWLLDRMHHLLLPVACLVIPILVYVERIQCAAVQEVIPQTYVRAARARGLSAARIFLNYCLRPALGPLLSTIGPLLAAVLSGSLVLEVIFAWPGLGQVTLNALLRLDLPLLLGCVIGSMVLLICGNLAGDLLLLVLDPRTHITEESL